MNRIYVLALILALAVPSTGLADLVWPGELLTISCSPATDPPGHVIWDFCVDTGGADWLSGLFYCELQSGTIYHNDVVPSMPWAHIVNDVDSWLAENVSIVPGTDGNELATTPGMSGDPANAAASICMVASLPDDPVPAWDGLAMRIVFSPDACGQYAFKISVHGSAPVLYTGCVLDGWNILGPPIPGDLDGNGYVNSADLDIVRANWGADVPPGDLLHGDPSGDGLVGSADLDIVRANWGSGFATVPEPAFAWIGLVVAGCFVRYRGKHSASCRN